MPIARKAAAWSIILLLALFLAGAWSVTIAPLTTGEVYPAYSSLRTDPLGAKALFESLSEQPGLEVSRLYKGRMPLDPQTALFILGVNSQGWNASTETALDAYEKLLTNGGRIVIAFLPTYAPPKPPDTKAIEKHWDILPEYRAPELQERRDSTMPRESALYFEPGPEWRVLDEHEGYATVVERGLGQGTVVLVADSYPLSNQGLADAENATLIASLAGPAKRVLFDENQFGISETGSVAVLIRKYRLEGALAVLFGVAGLFIWRSASSFLPPRADTGPPSVSGRDSHEGLAALLNRNIPEPHLLLACWKEWSRSAPQTGRAALAETEVQQWSSRDPVAGYRSVCRVLTEKK